MRTRSSNELAEQLWDSLEAEDIAPSDDEIEHVRVRRAEIAADGDPGEPWESASRS